MLIITIGYFGCKAQEKLENKFQSCVPCDMINALDLKDTVININQVEDFLCSVQSKCQNNVEFTEYSNSVIFNLLEKKTVLFLKAFSESNRIDKEYILRQISDPLKDYDINEITLKVEKIKCNKQTKESIIKALRGL